MRLLPWDKLPQDMRVEEVRPYYEALAAKQGALAAKRAFDVAGSLALIVILSWLILGVAVAVKVDSPGPVFYRQVRVTQYGRKFRIFKFRSMVQNADKIGAAVTTGGDPRVTRVGAVIRKYRLAPVIIGHPGGGESTNSLEHTLKTLTELRKCKFCPGIISSSQIHSNMYEKLSFACFEYLKRAA